MKNTIAYLSIAALLAACGASVPTDDLGRKKAELDSLKAAYKELGEKIKEADTWITEHDSTVKKNLPSVTTLAPGTATTEELIKGVKRGVLITRFWYTRMVDPQSLLITGLTRDGVFLIEPAPVRDPRPLVAACKQGRPSSTAIRVRRRGSRPIGASIERASAIAAMTFGRSTVFSRCSSCFNFSAPATVSGTLLMPSPVRRGDLEANKLRALRDVAYPCRPPGHPQWLCKR